MSLLKQGGFRAGVEREYDKVFRLVSGQVATDGVQESSVVTIGTTPVDVFSKTIDPGYTIDLDEIEFGGTVRLYGLNGSFVGSLLAWWQVQPKDYGIPSGGFLANVTGTHINITGTLNHNVATYKNAASYSEFTHSGYVPIGSIPYAPFEVKYRVTGIQAAVAYGTVKNSSFLRVKGTVIPGT